jgi:hypothetical protein
VRQEHHLPEVTQAGVKDRLLFKHIQPRAGQPTSQECIDQRAFIHHRTSRGIDQKRRGLHECQLPRTDQVMSLRAERYMQSHEVGFSQQVGQGALFPLR